MDTTDTLLESDKGEEYWARSTEIEAQKRRIRRGSSLPSGYLYLEAGNGDRKYILPKSILKEEGGRTCESQIRHDEVVKIKSTKASGTTKPPITINDIRGKKRTTF